MKRSWSTFGVDLHLELEGPGRRRALERALREAVADGRLAPGTRLPSSRTLAADVGVARNTVVDAYGQLTAEGWLLARPGSGTTVAERPVALAREPGNSAPAAGTPAPNPAHTPAHTPPPTPAAWPYDLRPGGPDLSSFPRSAWLAASRRAWSAAPDSVLGYGDPRGSAVLREALAGYLGRARGVRTDPARIVVCAGFTQAFGVLCGALRERGATTVAVECYGLPELRAIAARAGLGAVTVPVDEEGADLAPADGAGPAGEADAAVLTPAHQFPLGTVLSPGRRHAAVAWARAHGAVLVEDDYDGEFRYDREPLGALQALDPEHVVYAGTASKTLAPGIRLAWLALPPALVEPVAHAKLLADRHTPVPDQLTLAELIRSGAYDRHVRRRRLAYRRRRDRLMGALAPGTVQGVSAGLHALIGLPPGATEADIVAAAAARGLALEGLDAYRAGGGARPPALVVGYATPADHAYRAALTLLEDVLGSGARP